VGRRPHYRTWIRSTRVAVIAALTGVCLAGSALSVLSPWFLLFLVPFALLGYLTLILALTMYRRGSLVVKLASASADSTVTGVDSWGHDWEYSKDQCEDNARIEGVADRTAFGKHSGAALGFADGTFDAVVSCLTFHEIRDVSRKTDGVVEALRVLRPGGRFVFLDLFGDPAIYGSVEDVRDAIGRAGASIVEFASLADRLPLPYPLRHPRVLGHAMLIAGTKPRAD
jgi:SAM-dependent methyltransferase